MPDNLASFSRAILIKARGAYRLNDATARTTLVEKRICDISASCMTKIDKLNEVHTLRTKLKAHVFDLDSLDCRIMQRAVAALSLD